MTDANTIKLLLPELSLVVLAVWVYVGGVGAPGRRAWTLFAVVSLAIAAVALWRQYPVVDGTFQSGPLVVDSLAYTFRWVAIGVGLLFVLVASRGGGRELRGETIGTLLLITVALMLVASAGELVFLFLALELISIPTYVLLFLGRPDRGSAEATVKYFLLSILSSALFLYGLSFLYGMTGSTRLDEIARALAGASQGGAAAGPTGMGPLALVLVFAGLGFKITAVPLTFYAPDG